MATYQRKSTHTIEATQFTPALGDILRMFAAGTIPELPADVPALLVWSEQGGYRLDGAPISFGDYVVGGAVMSRADFERKWEPVIERPTARGTLNDSSAALSNAAASSNTIDDAAKEIFGTTPTSPLNESLSDVPSHVKPAPRTRRTRTEDAQ